MAGEAPWNVFERPSSGKSMAALTQIGLGCRRTARSTSGGKNDGKSSFEVVESNPAEHHTLQQKQSWLWQFELAENASWWCSWLNVGHFNPIRVSFLSYSLRALCRALCLRRCWYVHLVFQS